MARKRSSHDDDDRRGRHNRSSDRRRSSSRHRSSASREVKSPDRYGNENVSPRQMSSSHQRSSAERERSSRSNSQSNRTSASHSRSQRYSRSASRDASAFSYGPEGRKQKRLVVVDSTDSDSDDDGGTRGGSKANTRSISTIQPKSWINLTCFGGVATFIFGVGIAVLTTFLLMNDQTVDTAASPKSEPQPDDFPLVKITPTSSPTVAPTGMPTVQYPPPDLADCTAMSEGKDIRSTVPDGLPRNMDISFDVTVRPGGMFTTEAEWLQFFRQKMETALIPALAGCDDVAGFQQRRLNAVVGSKEDTALRNRELSDRDRLRYVIATGDVTGTLSSPMACPASASGERLSCFRVVVYFEFLLHGDERVSDIISLITKILTETSSQQVPVASTGVSVSSLVDRLELPNPPFQRVVATGVRNNDPTMEPSVSPTEFPTDEPSIQPSGKPTGAPSALPTGAPSANPSLKPTIAPSVIPTSQPTIAPSKIPTIAPTPKPTFAPTPAPSSFPTGLPSATPSAVPSAAPSAAPSTVPTISNAPSVSGAPSAAPSISAAPSSRTSYVIQMLPATFDDTDVIDWLGNTDTWLPPSSTAADEKTLWTERYSIVLLAKGLAGFAQSGISVCAWSGITCDGNGRVKEVLLPTKNLNYGIPSELMMLVELTKLDLSRNDYAGMNIPSELFGLVKMEYLDVSKTGLVGTIPREIINMVGLRELHVNDNNLVGAIPPLPPLVTRSPDDIITLANGVQVTSVCELYTNSGLVDTANNAGGCDLVRTASDSTSSSSSSDDSPTTTAPVSRFLRVRRRRLPLIFDSKSSSSEDQATTQTRKKSNGLEARFIGLHDTKAKKTKRGNGKRMSVPKHTKKGRNSSLESRDAEALNLQLRNFEVSEEKEK